MVAVSCLWRTLAAWSRLTFFKDTSFFSWQSLKLVPNEFCAFVYRIVNLNKTHSTPKSANEHFLKESSPNARWVFRIRFQNPVVFTFSESGLFFSFFLFFCADLVVTGNRVS
jgi:hypothetical protein